MTVEELLMPRYMIIVKVPLSRHKVGDVIYGDGDWYSTHRSQVDISCSAYPDVYRPMEWWEDRKVEDMPEYVKRVGKFRTGEVLKVAAPNQNMREWHIDGEIEFRFIKDKDLIPVTLEEYTEYINKLNS